MRETYYVGFDPQLKLWDVMSVIPDYPDEFWVFKVAARNESDALNRGFHQYQAMTKAPSEHRLEVFRHLHRQALKRDLAQDGLFCIDVPARMMNEAKAMIEEGFIMRGYEGQVVVDAKGTGWKCLLHQLDNQCTAKPTRRWDETEQSLAS